MDRIALITSMQATGAVILDGYSWAKRARDHAQHFYSAASRPLEIEFLRTISAGNSAAATAHRVTNKHNSRRWPVDATAGPRYAVCEIADASRYDAAAVDAWLIEHCAAAVIFGFDEIKRSQLRSAAKIATTRPGRASTLARAFLDAGKPIYTGNIPEYKWLFDMGARPLDNSGAVITTPPKVEPAAQLDMLDALFNQAA